MNYNPITKIGNTSFYVVEGDITQIPTDALMTAINSGGMWWGGIDRAIQRVAGNLYHNQAAKAFPLTNLQTVVAKGNTSKHKGQFNDVVFVVDDLETSVDKVVYAGLTAAHNEGYGSLLLPAIRLGVMSGVVEKTPQQTINKIGEGISKFFKEYATQTSLESITFVVYQDPLTVRNLGKGLESLSLN